MAELASLQSPAHTVNPSRSASGLRKYRLVLFLPPQRSIMPPVQTAVPSGRGALTIEVGTQASAIGSYRPPVPASVGPLFWPQMISTLPVQIETRKPAKRLGAFTVDVGAHASARGSYRPPVLRKAPFVPPQMTITLPVKTPA